MDKLLRDIYNSCPHMSECDCCCGHECHHDCKDCHNHGKNKKKEMPIDPSTIWPNFFKAAAEDHGLAGHFCHVLTDYAHEYPEFRSSCPADYLAQISTLDGEFESLEAYAECLSKFYFIAPFIPVAETMKIFESVISKLHKDLNDNQTINIKFYDFISDTSLQLFSEDHISAIIQFFETKFLSEQKVASVLFMSCFVEDLISIDGDINTKIIRDMDALKNGSDVEKMVCALLVESFAEEYISPAGQDLSPTYISDALFPMFLSQNRLVIKRAYTALYGLNGNDFFDDELLGTYLKLFPKLTQNFQYHYFFKLIASCLINDGMNAEEEEEEEAPQNISMLQPILNFVTPLLSHENLIIKAHALDIFGDLCQRSSITIEAYHQQAIQVFSEIIESGNAEAICILGSYSIAIQEHFKDTDFKVVASSMNKLYEVATGENNATPRQRLNLLTDICELLKDLSNPELEGKVINFIIERISSNTKDLIVLICAAIIGIRKKVSQESAEIIAAQLGRRLDEEEDSDLCQIYIQTLQKLFKKCPVSNDVVGSIIKKLMEGKLPFTRGYPPHNLHPPSEVVIEFISEYLKHYQSNSLEFAQKFIQWYNEDPASTMLIQLIEESLDLSIVTKGNSGELLGQLGPIVKRQALEGNKDVIQILTKLYDIDPELVGDVGEILENISATITKIASIMDEEEDELDLEELFDVIPDLSLFVLTVYNTDQDVDVNSGLIEILLKFTEEIADSEYLEKTIELLVSILEDTTRFATAVVPILSFFTKYLMMPRRELDELHFKPEIINSMKMTLKTIVKKKPAIGREISKPFMKSRTQMNRFNALIK